jgi:chromosome segregation ATPase
VDYNRDAIALTEKNSATIRVHTQELKEIRKYMDKKREESVLLQEVLDSYKDRMVEKFKAMSDEFNAELKSIDKRYIGLNEGVAQLRKRVDTNISMLNDDQVKIHKHGDKLEGIEKEIQKMKVFYSFEQRLKYAEDNHKSDLVALTLGI